ncbi:MAG: ABC-F family ATP-binding cassette domain-containing protein [Prevotellaceae bacterium]|jgi:ATP-binding cassette subfamily F protein uup|nr:ABC-F family ATP-binding cassette domain-containing protein [Prevotellaceae bacterium]
MTSYLQIENLTKSFGDKVLFENISFGIADTQKVALIAKNGMGKTTLLNIIAVKEDCDSGRISFKKDLRIAFLEQEPAYPPEMSVLDACFHSNSEVVRIIAEYEHLCHCDQQSPKIAERYDHILIKMDMLHAWDYETKAKQILGKLNIHDLEQKIGELSGGQVKRIALANALITEPDMLILDEPTNHLDLEMVEWLEDFLRNATMSLLMVTHDRYFLNRVCSDIFEIDSRQLYHYKGNFSYYLEKRSERVAANNAELDKANNLFRKELDWMRRQPQARATKAKARIDSFYDLEDKVKQKRTDESIKLEVKSTYIGNKIFEAKYINKSFGELQILKDFYYNFSRYEKLGIVGRNGTGKSTFIKMLVGEEKPDSGSFDIGETVVFGYYSQNGLRFDEQMKVIDVVRDIAEEIDLGGGRRMSASQFLEHFLFTPETQHNYVHKLSGGEKRRLYLCTVLMKTPNFLVLDEPTNDLDIVTLNILESYLQTFKGCIIVVSHDRYFMDKVIDHLLVFEGDARIKDFPGNYTDYREWREQQLYTEKKNEKAFAQRPTEKQPNASTSLSDRKKMSFKEKREFEALEQEIEALENEKKAIETALSGGVLSNDDIMQKSMRIAEIIDLLDEKTMRWLELSEKM